MRVTCTLFILMFLCSCEKGVKEIVSFDISSALKGEYDNNILERVTFKEVMPLSDEVSVGKVYSLSRNKERTVVLGAENGVFVFDAKGRYLNIISQKGSDATEYYLSSSVVANDSHIRLEKENGQYLYFNYNGKINNILSLSDLSMSGVPSWYMPDYTRFGENGFIGYILNHTGIQHKHLVVYNGKGEVERVFHKEEPTEGQSVNIKGFGQFSHYENQVCFFENSCDTVYCVTTKDLIPRYILHRNDADRPSLNFGKNELFVSHINESKDYLMFKVYSYSMNRDGGEYIFFICDKKSGETKKYKRNRMDEFSRCLLDNLVTVGFGGSLTSVLYPEDCKNFMPQELKKLLKGKQINPIIVEFSIE